MSETQSYKTVTFSLRDLLSIEIALQDRLARLRAKAATGDLCAAQLVEQYEEALLKVEAAL